MDIKLEICVSDPSSIRAAAEGGADRMELCSSLETGGITPSMALIKEAMASGVPVNVLIRPRSGDFLYSDEEKRVMLNDIAMVAECGVNGVVVGALNRDGSIDTDFLDDVIKAAGDCEITFHRAFDVCKDPMEAIKQLSARGVNRVLTSGCRKSAWEGRETIKRLMELHGHRLSIMAGAGVTPENIAELVKETGVREVHASAKETVHSLMEYRNENVNMGTADADEYARPATSAKIVKELKNKLNNL